VSKFMRALGILVDALREIFDESAYGRFLLLNQVPRGRSSYAAFLREQEATKTRCPKCC
jgi:hypothetical protein